MRRFLPIVSRKLQRDGEATSYSFTFCEIWQEIVQELARVVVL